MNRDVIIQLCDHGILNSIANKFGTKKEELLMYPGYEGATNLVYEYNRGDTPMILRISFNQERTFEQIQAEMHFINFLVEQGVNASLPARSNEGNLVEHFMADENPLYVVSFIKGKGMRVPDNQYQYRENVPIEEYFCNWGQMLGKMHAATKKYRPISEVTKRPDWFDLHKSRMFVESRIPERFPLLREQILSHLKEIKSLPQEKNGYGLIHGDFNDGNFTVDYSNGNMTVFDFDDCCYFWFIYELASAWEGGMGRVMYADLQKRKAFMDHYMEEVMNGYHRENTLSQQWMSLIPLFIQLIQIEEIMHFIQYINIQDEKMQKRIGYKIYCIEHEIPFKGFFDSIYSPEKPFSL